MKHMQKKTYLAFLLLSALFLGGCGYMPDFSGKSTPKMAGPNYRPLSADIAAMASAPAAPGAMTLYCHVNAGSAKFAKGWQSYQPGDFTLAENQRTAVQFRSARGDILNVQGMFDRGGQKLIFCPIVEGPKDRQIPCNSLYALDDDLQTGIKRTFDIPEAVMSGELMCAASAENLQALKR